jgi:hypothetical protein
MLLQGINVLDLLSFIISLVGALLSLYFKSSRPFCSGPHKRDIIRHSTKSSSRVKLNSSATNDDVDGGDRKARISHIRVSPFSLKHNFIILQRNTIHHHARSFSLSSISLKHRRGGINSRKDNSSSLNSGVVNNELGDSS